jgi:hypothetical protein
VISPAASAAGTRSQKCDECFRFPSKLPRCSPTIIAAEGHKQKSIGGLEPESLLTADGSAKMCRRKCRRHPRFKSI